MTKTDYAKFFFCAIGHPLLFATYLFFLSNSTTGDLSLEFYGIPLFFQPSTNVYRINPLTYIPYVIIIYFLWVTFQYFFLHQFRNFSLEDFLDRKFTKFYLVLCGLGYINLVFWLIGIEGNAFGFLFAIPLMILCTILICMELKMFLYRRIE